MAWLITTIVLMGLSLWVGWRYGVESVHDKAMRQWLDDTVRRP